MLFPRRGVILLSALAFITVLLIISQRSSTDTSKEPWTKWSKQIAENVGLGEWQWPSSEPLEEEVKFSWEDSVARPEFDFGVGKPPGYNFTKVLVIPRMRRENVTWAYEVLPDIEKVVYVADDRKATLHPPANKGHEVMVYLTYLIDNYDNLPDIMIFMHAHRKAWHNADLLGLDAAEMIRRLNPARVAREGFMNMRCQWYPGCPDWMHPGETTKNTQKSEQVLIAKAWAEIFPMTPIPSVLAQPCCSQFALSRDLVHSIPKDKFMFWRNWLFKTNLNDFVSGRVWEYMWQYAFTGNSYLCPVEHMCYCDGFGVCFGGKQEFEDFYRVRNERDKYANELLEWTTMLKKIRMAIARGKSIEDMEIPEPGRNDTLTMQIETLQLDLNERLTDALNRGHDPRLRAEELGREWHEGDGF